jgi:hypothetical protein
MSDDLDYVGVCRGCGTIVSWAHRSLPKKDLQRHVKEVVGCEGLSLERVSTEESRRRFGICTCGKNGQKPTTQTEMFNAAS